MTNPTRKELKRLREQVSHAEYRVDSRAVAEAIVRRRWAVSVGATPAHTRVSAVAASRLDPGVPHALAA